MEAAFESLESFIKDSLHIHHKLLRLVRSLISLLNEYLSVLGALILIAGAVYGCARALYQLATSRSRKLPSFRTTRIEMGNCIALGLELLVATDVLETLTKDTHEFSFELLGKIGCVAAFRTVLAYFLSREVSELTEHEEHKHGGAHHIKEVEENKKKE